MSKSIYINIPVKDEAETRKFYRALGFEINEQGFVVIDKQIILMPVDEDFFKQTTEREIADTKTTREMSLAIQVANREEVDTIIDAGVAAGGTEEGEIVEEKAIGMYSRGLSDIDGHRLNILCMSAEN